MVLPPRKCFQYNQKKFVVISHWFGHIYQVVWGNSDDPYSTFSLFHSHREPCRELLHFSYLVYNYSEKLESEFQCNLWRHIRHCALWDPLSVFSMPRRSMTMLISLLSCADANNPLLCPTLSHLSQYVSKLTKSIGIAFEYIRMYYTCLCICYIMSAAAARVVLPDPEVVLLTEVITHAFSRTSWISEYMDVVVRFGVYVWGD